MRMIRLAVAGVMVLGLAALAPAQDKKTEENRKNIVGTWETKEGFTIEFTKDGKLKVSIKIEDKAINVEGAYAVEGDKLTVTLKEGGEEKKESATIKKLDAQELVTVDKGGKEETLKR